MDEQVTFSHDAVYNVESGSGNKLQLEEGDVLSVKDCLYVMLFSLPIRQPTLWQNM